MTLSSCQPCNSRNTNEIQASCSTKGRKRLKGNGENFVPITSTEPQGVPSNREETLQLESQPGSSSSEVDADTIPPIVAVKRRWDYDSSQKVIGYKDQYYKLNCSNPELQSAVALEYPKGLIWVLQYYYRKTAILHLRPLEQLQSIVPPWNSRLLPDSRATLMTDPNVLCIGLVSSQSHLSDVVHYPEAGGSGQCGAANIVLSAVDEKSIDED
ncbi:hypothetical protein DAPPUDRAFT_261889 [Daphnia pulex]|uniref:Xrn1 helical domain-containing protein n=1 Tax=Daphnia pulex TaxID=6669 RepID=E9HLV9_DAPPU|nr:hypothetical protein DAPPUDRAFT_261889 [Daphnia pulex]|eukprot:EFX67249.1 hypothetical protein DAPPUDRAFT_261889 [Daphnia pulex]